MNPLTLGTWAVSTRGNFARTGPYARPKAMFGRRGSLGLWLALSALLLQLASPFHCCVYQTLSKAADLARLNPLPGFELSICGGHHASKDKSDHRQVDDCLSCLMCYATGQLSAVLPAPVGTVLAAPTGMVQPAAQDLILAEAQFILARSRAPPVSI